MVLYFCHLEIKKVNWMHSLAPICNADNFNMEEYLEYFKNIFKEV